MNRLSAAFAINGGRKPAALFSFLLCVRKMPSEGLKGVWLAIIVTCVATLLMPSIVSAQESGAANEAQTLLERELGFELPAPYIFVTRNDVPLYIHCNEPEGTGCPHGDAPHWDINGAIAAPRDSEYWGGRPPLYDLLTEAGWTAVLPQEGQPVTQFFRARENGACTRIFTLDPGWRDAQGVTLHIYPCERAQ